MESHGSNGDDHKKAGDQRPAAGFTPLAYICKCRWICDESLVQARAVSKPKPDGAKCRLSPIAKRKQHASSSTDSFYHSPPSTSPDDNMSAPQFAPAATAGGQQNGPVRSLSPARASHLSSSRYQISERAHIDNSNRNRYQPDIESARDIVILLDDATRVNRPRQLTQ